MPFTISDFHDLIRLLEQHPEWRAELRRLVLTEELLSLPALVRELAEAQARSEGRLARLEEAVAQLVEAQRRTDERLARLEEAQIRTEERLARLEEAQIRTEERLARLEEAVAQLVEAQRRTDERLARLEEAQARMEARLLRVEETLVWLIRRVDRIDTQVAELRGRDLERRYRERAGAYFSGLLRRVAALTDRELGELLDRAEEAGLLSVDEATEVRRSDVVVRGRRRADAAEVYLAVEVSAGVGTGDVERAIRRAELLRRALPPGTEALPAVAGEQIMPDAQQMAQERGVYVVLDGRAVEAGTEEQQA